MTPAHANIFFVAYSPLMLWREQTPRQKTKHEYDLVHEWKPPCCASTTLVTSRGPIDLPLG